MNALYFTSLQSELKHYEQPKGISMVYATLSFTQKGYSKAVTFLYLKNISSVVKSSPGGLEQALTYCWIFSISSASNSAAVLQVTGLRRCFVRSTGVLGCVSRAFAGFFETEPTNASYRDQQLMARPATDTGCLLRVVKASRALPPCL